MLVDKNVLGIAVNNPNSESQLVLSACSFGLLKNYYTPIFTFLFVKLVRNDPGPRPGKLADFGSRADQMHFFV